MIPTLDLIHDSSIGSTPAQVDRRTGEITVNPHVFYALTPFQQHFVILHELGHYHLQTTSEIEADTYAFDQLIGTEHRSLKQCLGSISELLDDNNATKAERYQALYLRALKWDAEHGNQWAKDELTRINTSSFFKLGAGIEWGAEEEGDRAVKEAQAESIIKQSAIAANTSKWASYKSVLNAVLVVGLCGFMFYYLFATKTQHP